MGKHQLARISQSSRGPGVQGLILEQDLEKKTEIARGQGQSRKKEEDLGPRRKPAGALS